MIQPPFQPYNITFYLEFWTYNSNHRAVHYSFTRLKKKGKKISTAWNNTLLIKWPWLQQQTCNHEQDYTSTAHTHSPAPPLCFLLFSPGISHCCRPSAHRAGEWLDQTSACLALAAKQKHTKEAQCRNHHAQTALCTYSSSGWCVCLLKITKDVDLITQKNTMYVIENNRVHYSVWPRFYWLHDTRILNILTRDEKLQSKQRTVLITRLLGPKYMNTFFLQLPKPFSQCQYPQKWSLLDTLPWKVCCNRVITSKIHAFGCFHPFSALLSRSNEILQSHCISLYPRCRAGALVDQRRRVKSMAWCLHTPPSHHLVLWLIQTLMRWFSVLWPEDGAHW